ncbi:zinc transporter ZIP1-like [Lingula anatina]|uniref:Zinc transporter ZIP1-like n=1 Tax=Lingula anatina TaxID=7574 RepID=A0A1S3JJB6_LINAN|nr:zinc transporter ZIP1-like [Lingula anatina]|eukprot:XP_013410477.1 zinc transporter ZIP1-like [Lingula anatina]
MALYNALLGSLNCFAGGVFLGVAFLHLIPEARAEMDEVMTEANIHTHYPLTELAVVIGLFLVLIFEMVLMLCIGRGGYLLRHLHGHSHHDADVPTDVGKVHLTGTNHGEEKTNGQPGGPSLSSNPEDNSSGTLSDPNVLDCTDRTELLAAKTGAVSKIRILLLYFALSSHAVFEGLALGLQDDSVHVWTLFGAMMVHEIIITFTLSMKLVETFSLKPFLIFIFCFSAISPIGIGIGIIITDVGQNTLATGLTTSILESLATGTFLYVTFFEILKRELENGTPTQGLRKTFFIVLGFAVMGALAIFEQHDH